MLNTIKVLSLAACTALVLQSCHSDDDALFAVVPDAAPQEVGDISGNAYGSLRAKLPDRPGSNQGCVSGEIWSLGSLLHHKPLPSGFCEVPLELSVEGGCGALDAWRLSCI